MYLSLQLIWFGIVFVCRLLVYALAGIRHVWALCRTSSFPSTTEATVKEVFVDEQLFAIWVNVSYEYEVRGQLYYRTCRRDFLFPDFAQAFARRFPFGASVLIRYDPKHPERSGLPSNIEVVSVLG